MALHRGIQSVLFYYLSCAPCTGWSYRKKKRKEAIRDRAIKQQMEAEQPGLYRQPSPFATNPNWQTEIDIGPTPIPPRGKKSMQRKGNNRNCGENESNLTSDISLPLPTGNSNDSTCNLRRQQREDEPLWGLDASPRGRSAAMDSRSTIGRPATARTVRTDRTSTSYYSSNHPPINDLHPPIVTRIENRQDALWMLQPPPSARIMAGKDRPARSLRINTQSVTASSPASSRSRRTDVTLKSRDVLSIATLDGAHASPDMRPSLKSASADNVSSEDAKSQRKRRPPPINLPEDSSPSSRSIPFDSAIDPGSAGRLQPKRALSPIRSESASARKLGSSRSTSRERPALAPVSRQDSSLNVLQEIVTPSLLNLRNAAKSPSFEARIDLPSPSYDEMELLGSGVAAFETWYESRDKSAFPEWVSERTKRDVTSRWSVDF